VDDPHPGLVLGQRREVDAGEPGGQRLLGALRGETRDRHLECLPAAEVLVRVEDGLVGRGAGRDDPEPLLAARGGDELGRATERHPLHGRRLADVDIDRAGVRRGVDDAQARGRRVADAQNLATGGVDLGRQREQAHVLAAGLAEDEEIVGLARLDAHPRHRRQDLVRVRGADFEVVGAGGNILVTAGGRRARAPVGRWGRETPGGAFIAAATGTAAPWSPATPPPAPPAAPWKATPPTRGSSRPVTPTSTVGASGTVWMTRRRAWPGAIVVRSTCWTWSCSPAAGPTAARM
jgi:hypothetical protein